MRLFAGKILFHQACGWRICCSAFVLLIARSAQPATLQIQISPKVSGENLQPSSFRYQTSAGETFSITRVSYLLSDFGLQRDDGSWLEFSNSVAWMDFEQNRDSVRFSDVPAGQFRALRFNVGLNANLNHADVSKFAADHPLNPNLNGLHWSWQGGYIFLALEGLWRHSNAPTLHAPTLNTPTLDGWAYHLARDTNSTRITLATPLELTQETKVELDFDLANVLNAPCSLSFAKDGSSTHSRDGDPIAAALVRNLPGSFRVRHALQLTDADISATHPKPLYLPVNFTPYEFKLNATFPIPDLPRDNPLTQERVALGKDLFFDKKVSINDQQSCADCHLPQKGFTDGRRTARGAEGEFGPRKTMPLFNLAWKQDFFWDGRAHSLRQQVLEPIQNPIEMHQSLTNLVAKLAANHYQDLFTKAFGSPQITAEKIALALESYLLTLRSCNAKFDRVLRGEEKFTAEEQRGFELFSTEYDPRRGQFGADCFHCHGGPLFRSQAFGNNGLDETFSDRGRAKVTGKDSDAGKFAVPSLRNVALTAPYMHDGRFKTLEEVVDHYTTGLKRSATLDPNLAKHPDGGIPLTVGDKRALVAFLKTLTDNPYAQSN